VTRPRREHWRFACAVIAHLLAVTPAAALDFPERRGSVVDDGGAPRWGRQSTGRQDRRFRSQDRPRNGAGADRVAAGRLARGVRPAARAALEDGARSVLLVAGPIDDTKATLMVGGGLKDHLTEALAARIRDEQINPCSPMPARSRPSRAASTI